MASLYTVQTLFILALAAIMLAAANLIFMLKLRHKQKTTHNLIKQVTREMNAVSTGSIGVGKKMVDMENRFRTLLQRQDTIEIQDESRDAYEQATKLIEKGVSCEDVAKTCHIPFAEAELLNTLHKMHIEKNGKST